MLNDEFYVNQEFEGIYPPEAAIWCNEQGSCRIEKISTEPLMFKIVENPMPTLAELKAVKRSEINAARDLAEQGGFEYLGKTFDSDPVSCQRISCAAQAMAYAPAVVTTEAESVSEQTITWTCQDNTTIDLSASQLQGLVAALAQHSNTCHQKATALKKRLDAAETAEEIAAIAWGDDGD